MTLVGKAGAPQNMEQQAVGSKRLRVSRWFLAALLLVAVFLINNRDLISGARVQIWDACSFYTPAFTLVADHARSGQLLLWDPWLAGGTPDFADPQVGAASPIAIIAGAIGGGNAAAFRAYWLFIWVLGPLGLLLLARHLGAPPWGAFLVALGYAFCGFYTAHAEHTAVLYSFSFVPWFIWRFDVALTSLRFTPAAQAGALWGLSALGGYPAIVILSGVMLFLWGLGRCCSSGNGATLLVQKRPIWDRFRFTLLALAIVFCIGVLIMAPTYVAFFREGLGYTERAGAMPRRLAIAGSALDPRALATFASPYLTALKFSPRNPKLWPKTSISMADVYIGVLPFILSLLALWHRPRSVWRWWLVGIIAFFMVCAVGDRLPVRGWLYDYCPPTRYFTYPAMFRGYGIFSAAVLALLATSDLEAAIQNGGTRIWRQLAVLSLTASIAAVWAYVHVVSHVTDLGNQFYLSNLHLAGIWFGAVVFSLLLLMFQKTRKRLAVLFGVLAILDACLTLHLSQQFVSDNGWTRLLLNRVDAGHKTALTLSGLQRELKPPLVFGPFNQTQTLKIATFYNDSTMTNRFHQRFFDHPVLLNMGLGANRIWFSENATIAVPSNLAYLALVNRSEQLGAPVIIVHPPAQMARVSLTSPAVPDRTELASISRLASAQNIPAEVLKYAPNDLKLKVSCPADGWLLVTDRWAAGWRAKVNGIPVEVFGGNFIFRAVRVGAGENTIEFYYPQRLYFALVLLSWTTLVAVFAMPRLQAARPAKEVLQEAP
ncbi:MAG TPA: hypothetical protein VGY75_05900 [Candidatus Udaeobacter sp.]|jgi:hypothetical protein|nr:hypothetical protein [Candidatus Udaeobacter sp.]